MQGAALSSLHVLTHLVFTTNERLVQLLTPISWGNENTERLSNLLGVTQLGEQEYETNPRTDIISTSFYVKGKYGWSFGLSDLGIFDVSVNRGQLGSSTVFS